MKPDQAPAVTRTRFAIGLSAIPVMSVLFGLVPGVAAELPRLRVSANGRSLVTENGKPFFWLADTAWSIIDQSVRDESDDQPGVERYFLVRKKQGFNVIQTHFLTNLVRGPIDASNAYGHEPFVDADFAQSRIVLGPSNDYWDHADYVIDLAGRYGMYVAVVAAWSNSFENDEHPMVRDPDVAYAYGRFLGARYRDRNHIIWLLGGDAFGRPDRGTLSAVRRRMTRALAEGIADGVSGDDTFDGHADWTATLMSYHPPGGGKSSSQFLHDEPWLDFNMIQSTTRFGFRNYETVSADYAKKPPKPTLDAEVAYEYSLPLSARQQRQRPGARITPWDVRRAAYWNVFAGGFGHTYGHRNLIGWVRAGDDPLKWGADRPWFESLDSPGARQMKHLKALIESRPMLSRIPDQSLVVSEHADGDSHVQATRAADGSYAFVYLPTGSPVTIDADRLAGETLVAHWYNPRTGDFIRIASSPRTGHRQFTPTTQGKGEDWVLVLDDASKDFPPPGTSSRPPKVVAPASPNASPATCRVLEYLYSLTSRRDKRVVSGQFLDHGTQASLDEVAEVHDKTGKWVGMVGGDYYGRDDPPDVTDASWSRDANWKETNRLFVDYWKRGGLVTLCLHPFNPQSGKSAWIKKSGDTINLTDVLTPGRPGHDTWMRQLDLIAEGLQELEDEGVVVLFRPFHEMSGNWFWWGSMNTKREFVNLWKHMFDYFTDTKGLDNLLWYYCPSGRGGAMDFYPGDDYVDLVGVDYYGRKNSGPNLADIRRNGYADLTATGKPFGLGEFGPYHGINFLESPPNDYDCGKFIRDIKEQLPLCTSFLIWHQYYGLQFQKNAPQCLDDPWTANRADLPCFRQPQTQCQEPNPGD